MSLHWHDAVKAALGRMLERYPDGIITLKQLKVYELKRIVRDTGSTGRTPGQTLQRVCQELRDIGVLEFIDDRGTYRIRLPH